MAGTTNLMQAGIAALAAKMLGGEVTTGVSAAGSTAADATPVAAGLVVISTAAASTGVILPSATISGPTVVVNGGANTVAVYPATGEKINNGTASASVNVTNAKNGIFIPFGNQWGFVLGA